MTNEEIALQIQAGNTALYAELWEQTQRFIYKCANSFYNRNAQRCARFGVELDDLYQMGFIALKMAVEAFQAESGYKLLTYIKFPLKNLFNYALGLRTNQHVTLDTLISLDAPITEDSETALGETMPDFEAGESFSRAEDAEFARELHIALEKALATLPAPMADAVKNKYYKNIDCDKNELNKGMRLLRKWESVKHLASFRDEIINTKAYSGTGFFAWESFGSVEERVTEIINDDKRVNQYL